MNFSSEPPTAALFLWGGGGGNLDVEIEMFERDSKIRSRLTILSEIEFFDRWALWDLNVCQCMSDETAKGTLF